MILRRRTRTHSTLAATAFLLTVLGLPVQAAEPPTDKAPATETAPKSEPVPEINLTEALRSMRTFLTDEELKLVYDYVWDASLAALKGSEEPVEPPPEIAFKLAILQKRMVKEGGYYMQAFARRMERDLARWHAELLAMPPPAPYRLPQEAPRATPAQP